MDQCLQALAKNKSVLTNPTGSHPTFSFKDADRMNDFYYFGLNAKEARPEGNFRKPRWSIHNADACFGVKTR